MPFPIPVTHIGTWLLQDPTWDWTTLTCAPSSGRREIVIWHGLSDQLIFPQGTVNYYERVKALMDGSQKTEEFARLFLAPGDAHCGGGTGPSPDEPLSTVVDWVEHGRAPRVLNGVIRDANGAVTQSRPICLYPEVAAYKGHGDPAAASSFVCRRG